MCHLNFKMLQLFSLMLLCSLQTTTARPLRAHDPTAPSSGTELPQTVDEAILHELDDALTKLANVYMQALFSGTHTPELAAELDTLQLRFYDLLDSLYREQRMSEYMKYEAEVTHQLLVYNLLKKLFGYANDDESTQ